MKILKGQLLKIVYSRKTPARGWCYAERDFDTEKDEFYPVRNALRFLEGMSTEWRYGDRVPARRGLDVITVPARAEVERQLKVAEEETARVKKLSEIQPGPEDEEILEELRHIGKDLRNALRVIDGAYGAGGEEKACT